MSAKLIIGPAASGKTDASIDRILSVRQQAPLAPIWVVLPNRAQVVNYRRRFARKRGGFGVRIETIDAFIEEITIRLGCQRPRASNPVRRRMVQTALHTLVAKGELSHFEPIAGTAGLSHLLSERFLELKRAGWTAQRLMEQIADWDQPLQELSFVFNRYQEQLDQLGWEDDEGLAKLAAEQLQQAPDALADLALVVVDGFDSFTVNQRTLLKALVEVGCETLITLPSNRENPVSVFPRFRKSLDELTSSIPNLEIMRLEGGGFKSQDILFLAHQLNSEAQEIAPNQPNTIEWVKAQSINAEVREALRWIKAVTVRRKLPLQACALVLTNAETYEASVREVAQEFDIPLRFGLGQQLQEAPSIAALIDLLRLPLIGWSRRLTLDAIRSPFFNLSIFNLFPADAAKLEAASYWGQVVAGIDQWLEALERLAKRAEGDGEVKDEKFSVPLPKPAEAQRLQAGLQKFSERLEPGQSRALSDWVIWFEDLLQELGFFERAETKMEQAATLRLRELLRALLLSEQVMGESKQEFLGFFAELEGVIERARYQPKPEWRKAALQVEGLEAVRGLRFSAVAVVGLSEGQLPAVEREDPLLDEATRSSLELEPRIGTDQLSTFYSAITRADELLLLSRPTMAEDGEEWQPSPYWVESLRLFGKVDEQVSLLRRGDIRPMADAGSAQEVVFLAVRRGSLPKAFSELEPRLEPLRRARPLIEARLAEVAAGPFEGDLNQLAPDLRQLLGADHVWSPSRLESYGTCPHLYLSGQLLDLELVEEPTLGPDARQLGSLLHQLLELAYQAAADPSDPNQVISELRRLAAERFEQAPDQYGFRPSPLWHIESDRLYEYLESSVQALANEGQGWQPFAYEATFGLGQHPALHIITEQGEISVRGVVDRLDRKGDQIRVIDYKTGGSHLGRSDLLSGRRLQLPLYALAAERSLQAGAVSAGFYWNIRSAKAGGLKLEKFNATWGDEYVEGVKGAYQVLHDHLSTILQGVRSGSFEPKPPQGGCPTYCPAAAWCWRYSPGFRP